MAARSIYGVALFVAVFLAPWWGTLALAVYGAWRFPSYYEAIIAGACLDILYGTAGASAGLGFGALGLFSGAVLFLATQRIKRELRA